MLPNAATNFNESWNSAGKQQVAPDPSESIVLSRVSPILRLHHRLVPGKTKESFHE